MKYSKPRHIGALTVDEAIDEQKVTLQTAFRPFFVTTIGN